MLTKQKITTARKINELIDEVNRLRSALIGCIAKDQEGDYQPAFIESVLKASKEKPVHS